MSGVKEKNYGYKPTPVNNAYWGGKEPRKPKTHKIKIKIKSKHSIIKNVRNLFGVLKESKAIRNKIIRDIRTGQQGITRITRNGDRSKTLSIKEYLD